MVNNKTYEPYTIPKRKKFLEDKMHETLIMTSIAFSEINQDPFTEIEVKQQHTGGVASTIPIPQKVNSISDEKRTLFYAMRQIARNTLSVYGEHSDTFYQQALFMKDFEDYYIEQSSFSSYYPYYQMMRYEQLRTYFTWRTQVREGNIADTSVSYAFLYIYELLNNIGVVDPQDGLDKLMTFWQAFRVYNTVIDRYVVHWLKDYHVYYPLQHSFQEFVNENNMQMYYPTVYGYKSGLHDSFDIYMGISKYKIQKSIFYYEQTSKMIHYCFYFILKRLREVFEEKNKCFEDFVFFPIENESTWTPFSQALFYTILEQQERQINISERESYTYRNNNWVYKTVIFTEHGRQLIGYIMKEMEVNLRKIKKFKYKIAADINMCDRKVLKKLKDMNIVLPKLIQDSVSEFYSLFTRRIIKVDKESLKQIRKEALTTQEKLIVPESTDAAVKEIKQKEVIVLKPVSDIWKVFEGSLTQTELQALTNILQKQDIKGFAITKGIMLEVLVDEINQKAVDCIGDIILEVSNTVTVYDEYKEKLLEMVKCNDE